MLEVRDLEVRYGDLVAVDRVSLDVAEGEVVALLGPSGCGKSSLLRVVAGLEPPRGTVHLGGRDLTRLRPDKRGLGLMFQDHALFPHRDVGGNVAFGLRMRQWRPDAIAARVESVLELVGLDGFGDRRVDELSGGERQRVALARAIAPGPKLLMLDEPLGSIDRALRDRLLEDLPPLFAETGASVLYVTHDHGEALALADRVVLLREGRIEQQGPPDELWRRPANRFVAEFLGLRNVLDAEVSGGVAETAIGPLPAPPGAPAGPAAVVLLPDALTLDTLSAVSGPRVEATVLARSFAGSHFVLRVLTDASCELDVPVWVGTPPTAGARVGVGVDPAAIVVLAGD